MVVGDKLPQQCPLRRRHPRHGGGRIEGNHKLIFVHLPSVSQDLRCSLVRIIGEGSREGLVSLVDHKTTKRVSNTAVSRGYQIGNVGSATRSCARRLSFSRVPAISENQRSVGSCFREENSRILVYGLDITFSSDSLTHPLPPFPTN